MEYSFEQLHIKAYKIKNNAEILYRIYKDDKDFIDLEVSSLQEAIEKSKIENPMKVEVILCNSKICLEKEELEECKEPMKIGIDVDNMIKIEEKIEMKNNKNVVNQEPEQDKIDSESKEEKTQKSKD